MTHLFNGPKYGKTKMCLTSLLRGNTSNHVGTVRECFLDVESCLVMFLRQSTLRGHHKKRGVCPDRFASKSLTKNFRIFVDEEIACCIFIRTAGRGMREQPHCNSVEKWFVLSAQQTISYIPLRFAV